MANLAYMSATKLLDLVQQVNRGGKMLVQVKGTNALVLGEDPFTPKYEIDLANERLIAVNGTEASDGPTLRGRYVPGEPSGIGRTKAGRRSGNYWVELRGRRVECASLKEALAEGLRQIENLHAGMLDSLCLIKPRSKRIVAHDPTELFDSAELRDKYAERLVGDWWYGTNNSAQETAAWLKRACAAARLAWGRDFRVSWETE